MKVDPEGITAIAFDLGNTLLPYGGPEAERLVRNLFEMASVSDRSIGWAEFRDSYDDMVRAELALRHRSSWESDPLWRAQRICISLEGKGMDPGPLASRLVDVHPEAFSRSLVFPEASISVLRGLRSRGLKIGLVSNAMDGAGIRLALRRQGIGPLLDHVVVSQEEGIAKPDPRIFQRSLGGLGVDPHECAYVGDRYEIDVLGARGAGMRPIYTREYGTEGEPPGIFRDDVPTIMSLGELLDIWEG